MVLDDNSSLNYGRPSVTHDFQGYEVQTEDDFIPRQKNL